MSLSLRIIAESDAEALCELLQANKEHLQPWEPLREPAFFSERGQRELIRQSLRAHELGAQYPFVIVGENGELLGRLNLNSVIRGALQSCAISYWVRADRLRRGYASQAVHQAVRFAFDVLGLHRVQAETLPENLASQAVLKRAGFTLYGVTPQYLKINGMWRDHLMFHILSQ